MRLSMGRTFYLEDIMFISLSKTIARFGGFRLGIGIRLNKKNAIWLSLIVIFVAMFQLMWYMLILCGWMIYAICYGIYWCIKKIAGVSSKKRPNKPKQQTTQNPQVKRKEDSPNMSPQMNNSPNEDPKNQCPKNKSTIIRWILGGFFAMFALVNGFHYSSLFLLCASFLMFPLPFMETFFQKKNIKTIVAIILSVALFLTGVLTSPRAESTDSPSDDTTQTTPSDNADKNNDSTKPDTSTNKLNGSTTEPDSSTSNNSGTTKPNNTTTDDEKVEMVWVASSGTKYHSKSSCSNMNSPRQIPLENAKNQGYTACKKCH